MQVVSRTMVFVSSVAQTLEDPKVVEVDFLLLLLV